MALRERFFAAESTVICHTLNGCTRVFDSATHTFPDARVFHTVAVGQSFGFSEEEVHGIVEGKFDKIIIQLLYHPDPRVAETACGTVLMSDRLLEVALGKPSGAVRGMSIEGKQSLVIHFMNRPRSQR